MFPSGSVIIPGFEHYRVTLDGKVYSCIKRGSREITTDWRELRQSNTKYPTVSLTRPGKKPTTKTVHVLILLAFRGPRPEGMLGCHSDDDGKNNHINNLFWKTRKQNREDQDANGNGNFGERHPLAKLKEADVLAIRSASIAGVSRNNLAQQFHISAQTVSDIVNRRRWRYLV